MKFNSKICQLILVFAFSSSISYGATIQGNVLTTDVSGNMVLVWNDSSEGVMASISLSGSGSWSTPVSLSASSFTPLSSDIPSVSMNSVGDIAVAWEATDPSNGSPVVCVGFGILSEGWTSVTVVSDPSLEFAGNIDEKIVIQDDRNTFVSWTSSIEGETYLRGANGVLNSLSTQSWAAPFTVSN